MLDYEEMDQISGCQYQPHEFGDMELLVLKLLGFRLKRLTTSELTQSLLSTLSLSPPVKDKVVGLLDLLLICICFIKTPTSRFTHWSARALWRSNLFLIGMTSNVTLKLGLKVFKLIKCFAHLDGI